MAYRPIIYILIFLFTSLCGKNSHPQVYVDKFIYDTYPINSKHPSLRTLPSYPNRCNNASLPVDGKCLGSASQDEYGDQIEYRNSTFSDGKTNLDGIIYTGYLSDFRKKIKTYCQSNVPPYFDCECVSNAATNVYLRKTWKNIQQERESSTTANQDQYVPIVGHENELAEQIMTERTTYACHDPKALVEYFYSFPDSAPNDVSMTEDSKICEADVQTRVIIGVPHYDKGPELLKGAKRIAQRDCKYFREPIPD